MSKKNTALILGGLSVAAIGLGAILISRNKVEPTTSGPTNPPPSGNILLQPPTSSDPLGVNIVGSPLSGDAPLSVSFQASPYGGIGPYNFIWFFADGITDNTQNPNHIYQSSGSYVVQCKVSDQQGKSFTAKLLIIVNPPQGQITPPSGIGNVPIGNGTTTPQPASGSVITGDIVLSGSPLGPNGEILEGNPYHLEFFLRSGFGAVPPYTYDWDFGDGSPHSSGSTADHVWKQSGTITITLTIKSSDTSVTEFGVTHIISGTTSIIRSVENVIVQKLQTGDVSLIPKSTSSTSLFDSDMGIPQEYVSLDCNLLNNRSDRSITCYVQVKIIRNGSAGATVSTANLTILPGGSVRAFKFIGQVTNDGQTQAVVTVFSTEPLQGTEAFLNQVTQTI